MSEWRVYGCGSASSGCSLQSSYEWVEGGFRLQVDFGNGALYRRCIAQNGMALKWNRESWNMKNMF